jgi:TolB-like protein/DNA-binding SARP family transcriptional activator
VYTLRLLGTASIEGPNGPVGGRAAQGRRLALLALLALARGRALSRDKVVATLWPDATPDRARPQLSDTLYILRGALGEAAVCATGDDLATNPDVVTTDVAALGRSLRDGRLEEAIELYRGPLLDGFHVSDAAEFERWLDAERDSIERQVDAALETLAETAESAGDRAGAVAWWRRRAVRDPVDGRIALRLMRALDAAGDRAGALRHAHIHAALAREELDAEPDAEVTAFAERLRREPAAAPARPPAPAQLPAPSGAPAPIAEGDSTATSTVVAPPAPRAAAAAPGRRRWAIASALLVLIVAIGYGTRRGVAADAPRSIGVLPFVNMSPDPANTYFSDGLSEQIILALSRIEGLRVAARTSSFALRDRELGVRAIADTLGVQAVLEGSVLADRGRLRVNAQLIDARTGYHIWSAHYDRELDDAIAVQDSVAQAIASALHLRFAAASPPRGPPAISMEAYDLYLRGLHLRNGLQPDALRQAAAYFDRAIAMEPGFARAWAAKASVTAPMAYFRYASRDSVVAVLREQTSRALALDSASGEAHAALGVLKLFYEWDWAGARAALSRAIALNPSDAHAWHHLANYHGAMLEAREATAARATALRLDPLNPRSLIVSARDLLIVGDAAAALDQARRAARLDPVHPLLLGTGPMAPVGPPEILLRQGRVDEAVEAYLRVAALRGASPQEIDALRRAYAAMGVRGFWKRWLAMDIRLSPVPNTMRMASLHALAGDTAQALDWLERALAERNPGLIYVRREPSLAPLHGSPRYQRVVRAMRFPG